VQCYGQNDTFINWFKSYVVYRRHKVILKINNTQNYYSIWETVTKGVAQGSVLEPLLFITYINKLLCTLVILQKVYYLQMVLVY